MAEQTVPARWVLLFLLVALGVGAAAMLYLGASFAPAVVAA